jgi:hypothetical protein
VLTELGKILQEQSLDPRVREAKWWHFPKIGKVEVVTVVDSKVKAAIRRV